jgi:hypothetical protein
MSVNFKNIFKKILIIIGSGVLLLTINYFTSNKKTKKHIIKNKKKISEEAVKKIINLLDKIILKNPNNYNSNDIFIISLINKYTLEKKLKEITSESIDIKRLLLCKPQNLTSIGFVMKHYKSTCFSVKLDYYNYSGSLKISIINYFSGNLLNEERKENVIYFDDKDGNIKNFNESIINFGFYDLQRLQVEEIYIICEPLKNLPGDKEFHKFIEENIDVIEENI